MPEWTNVYRNFEKIAYAILDANGVTPESSKIVDAAIFALFMEHRDDPVYITAYQKWIDCVPEE